MSVESGTHRPRQCLTSEYIVDTDSQSYHAHSPHDVFGSAKVEKKHKYLQACQDQCTTFTPLCVSVDDILGSEAEVFVKKLPLFLSLKLHVFYLVCVLCCE